MQTQEAIKKFLLKKKNVTKLEIFLFLTEHQFFITTHYLADYFRMSDSNFLLYLQELEQDFKALDIQNVKIVKNKKFVKISLEEADPATCYYELFGKYCFDSTNFQIIAALLRHKVNSMVTISQMTNYSPSYLYSKMKAINQFLALYGISFKFSSKGKKIITGSEIQIQYCFLDVYWTIFANTSLPYHQEEPEQINATLYMYLKKEVLEGMNGGVLDKLYLLLNLCQDNFPMTSLENVQKELSQFTYIDLLIQPDVDILKPDLPICREQRILLNLLARLTISQLDSEEQSLTHYQRLLELDFPYLLYSKRLVESFSQYFHLELHEKQKRLYALSFTINKLHNTFLDSEQPNTPLPTFLLYQDQANYQQLRASVADFYERFREENWHYLPEFLERENVSWVIEELLHFYDRFKKQPPIVIGVNHTKDFYISKDLIVKIEQIFSKEAITIQRYYMEQCDIVISDCPLKHLPEKIKKIYLLNGIVRPNDWKKMISQLAEYIFEIKQERDYADLPAKLIDMDE
ncbi:helix-turn-helix domain-containing protein [Enterococcus sp. DIV1298c]|uniref:helix-turn-helix domain-containing protein n=1 Tax=Enterococcus sp. DIV1298c TaxID=2815328 RepID=UPI001A93763E|nr:helix-turn-helix domain-containing protein [Enterococcus sp. DIV1298c]MBO0462178.1 helix-turn-helix domain-containing protein [Enterococcus sp. DIV1298c]